ncbi:MAG: enoyl-CoA hydratase/isomerase family protein [Nitrospirae bacterium]|nr:enoyl-CoA hydratase/isomerase family protein [Nitrospirota bacterium]
MPNVLTETNGSVLKITFNRPDALNAINQATARELDEAVATLAGDPEVKVGLFTGAGDKAFVAGADVKEIPIGDPAKSRAFIERMQKVTREIETCRKPTIAAINGFALGGGMEVALACSIRIASEKAKMGLPEINLGIMPGWGGTQRLARLVGVGRAMHLTLTGDFVTAQEALAMGLVTKVVPPEKLAEEADTLAAKLAQKAGPAMAAILQAVKESMELPTSKGLELESRLFEYLSTTQEAAEGVKAFIEKRKA